MSNIIKNIVLHTKQVLTNKTTVKILRCSTTKTLLDIYSQEAPAALLATYGDKAHNDYGAHYHVMKLFGWLKYAPGYDLLVENLHNREPQFQKSRAACAIALGELGNFRAIPEIKICLNTPIWDLKICLFISARLLRGIIWSGNLC